MKPFLVSVGYAALDILQIHKLDCDVRLLQDIICHKMGKTEVGILLDQTHIITRLDTCDGKHQSSPRGWLWLI